jgi:hypothetical protein
MISSGGVHDPDPLVPHDLIGINSSERASSGTTMSRLRKDGQQVDNALRVTTLCQAEDGLQHQLAVFHVSHHFMPAYGSRRWLPR